MPEGQNRKWWEGSIFLLILLLAGSLVWAALSHWKRTPHIYAYDDGMNMRREQELADAGEQEDEEQQESQQTTPPEEQDEDSAVQNPDMDNQDSSDKKQGEDDDKPEDSDDGEPGAGDGDGVGEEGDDGGTGDGDGEPVSGSAAPAESVNPGGDGGNTPVPVPTRMPTPTPEASIEPSETPVPEDRVVSLTCTWDDKDTLLYRKPIPKDSIKVKAKYASGREETLSASDYTISGLNNDSIGVHTMTVIYEDAMCRLNYTVNNYIDHIEYDWPTRMECYKGELIDGEVLTVNACMADNTEREVADGRYRITGIDNQKTGVQQTFRITYEGFSVEGTCLFTEQRITVTNQFYGGGILQSEETDNEAADRIGDTIADETGTEITRNGRKYVLKIIKVLVGGREQGLPYDVDERDFEIQIIKRYEEE